MHPTLERLAKSADHYERGETAWDVKLARDRLAEAAPALIAALVEIEALCQSATTSDPRTQPAIGAVTVREIIHKHLEPLK